MTSAIHGRDAETRAVAALLDRTRAGQGGALVVRGEAGIGKTALLDVAAAAARGMRVLRATAIETEAELPFAGLHLLLRPVLGRLDRVPRPQALALERAFGHAEAAGPPADDVFLAGLAVLSLLTETVEGPEGDRPLLCLVDDAQWLDRASATALLFAARRLDSDGVAVVLAVRDGSRPLDTHGMQQLQLGPLDEAAARRLLDDAAAGLDPHLGERVLADAAGSPLAITELARAAAAAPPCGHYGRPGPLAAGQAAARAKAPGVLARLTPQEYQIVALAAQGQSNREIAARLFLSHRTVGYHLYKAYPKLGVSSRAELAALIAVQAR
jgi:DNA-binding CsgD family transcriptional regulator